MAKIQWRGGADAVVQIASASIDSYDAATTYTLAVGDYSFSSLAAGSANAAAAALVAAAAASDIPYFAAVTWTNPSGATITGTHVRAGDPFEASLSVTGGTGTRTDFVDGTACTGPHHANNPQNYVGGALPSASDTLVAAAGASILYGLDALAAIALADVEVQLGFPGIVGLNPAEFSTSLNGLTTDPAYPEYRTTHLQLNAPIIRIGDHDGAGLPSGPSRVFLDQKSTAASRLLVLATARSSVGAAPVVDYLANDADADVDVRSAPAGVGLASFPGNTAVFGEIAVTDLSQESLVSIGDGATYTNFTQQGGTSRIRAAATVTNVEIFGGDLVIEGEGYTVTALNVEGGTCTDRHLNGAGAEWVTINVRAGTLRLPEVFDASSARSFTTINLSRGRIEADWNSLSGTVAINPGAGVSSSMAVDALEL